MAQPRAAKPGLGRSEEPTNRTRSLDLPCSDEEVTRWTRAAQAEGMTTVEFLRAAADERAAQLVS
jgi:hypothetical protein